MNYQDAKSGFIQSWCQFTRHWGLNRTMSKIHALLIVSNDILTTEDIMKELAISRGNTSMNVRELIKMGLAYKTMQKGERKEFYGAEKNIWKITEMLMQEKRRREIKPLQDMLFRMKDFTGDNRNIKIKTLRKQINEISAWSSKIDHYFSGLKYKARP